MMTEDPRIAEARRRRLAQQDQDPELADEWALRRSLPVSPKVEELAQAVDRLAADQFDLEDMRSALMFIFRDKSND